MSFLDTIRAKIGETACGRIETVAEKEVALAMQMPLLNEYKEKKFYAQRFLLGELLADCELFDKAELKILPTDVVTVLFRCKLLYAAKTESEYIQRRGIVSFIAERARNVEWEEQTDNISAVMERHFSQLQTEIQQRTLLAHISGYDSIGKGEHPQVFFDELFAKLVMPFTAYFDDGNLIEKHKKLEAGQRNYDQPGASEFFCAPSFGFATSGSMDYCFWHSSFWLRTFLNLLRIAGYLYGPIDFGMSDVRMTAPTYPVFLGGHSGGAYKWDEDTKESWAKIPDGCLFLSFGYRGLSKLRLDIRTFARVQQFFLNYKPILDCLKNPWTSRNKNDVAPTLDILSSATQIPDLGAKILLVYCCLEHLFVPRNTYSDNKKYIVGGLNALGPHLLPWFNRLYDLRCAYAHKGFVLRNDDTMTLIRDSMKNVMSLLVAKLSVS